MAATTGRLSGLSSPPGKVLIVEDEAIIALDLQFRLAAMGLVVCDTVDTGQLAIDRTRVHRPNLVLMDYKLRGPLTGLDAALAIRAAREVPIIFLTGHRHTIPTAVLEELGARLLCKPFRAAQLSSAVREALGGMKERADFS